MAPICAPLSTWAGSPIPNKSPCNSIASRCRNSAWRRSGHGPIKPPQAHRARVETYFDPLPIWYPPFGEDSDAADYPTARDHPAANGDVPFSWGSQNAWLRQIHGANRLFVNRATAAAHGLEDDDWAWIESPNARVKGQIKCMEGCNPNTVWTWNAIGKRRGAWNLDDDAHREGTQ